MVDGHEQAASVAEPTGGALVRDRELTAVVAHGLLSTCFVLSGSAFALRQFGVDLSESERGATLEMLAAHATLLDDGLRLVIQHCSDAFADAATAVVLAARAIPFLSSGELPEVLDGLAVHLEVVASGLQSLVRGLPVDVVLFLDAQQPAAGAGAGSRNPAQLSAPAAHDDAEDLTCTGD